MDDHQHCWHAAYAGQGLWISVCCRCGRWWIPEDYINTHPVEHGPYGGGGLPMGDRLTPDEVRELFGFVLAPSHEPGGAP